jgi:hypothetical protein
MLLQVHSETRCGEETDGREQGWHAVGGLERENVGEEKEKEKEQEQEEEVELEVRQLGKG